MWPSDTLASDFKPPELYLFVVLGTRLVMDCSSSPPTKPSLTGWCAFGHWHGYRWDDRSRGAFSNYTEDSREWEGRRKFMRVCRESSISPASHTPHTYALNKGFCIIPLRHLRFPGLCGCGLGLQPSGVTGSQKLALY